MQAAEVVEFWFSDRARSRWFARDAAFDDEIRARFADAIEAADRGDLAAWRSDGDGDGALALVILLDQFPRNIHRGSPRAFAHDARAREEASWALDHQVDQAVAIDRRSFFYLPFEHSEQLADQDRSVALFTRWVEALAAEAAGAHDELRYAVRHREIIQRFGRFPHRNAVLGRSSTAEELAFLQEPGSSF